MRSVNDRFLTVYFLSVSSFPPPNSLDQKPRRRVGCGAGSTVFGPGGASTTRSGGGCEETAWDEGLDGPNRPAIALNGEARILR